MAWLRLRTRLPLFLERKQAEEQLTVAKRLAEEASVAKSQFLATMSHELRTPLNGVIGMTELLTHTKIDERQLQFVNACHSSGESLLQLINNILDLSKIEAGKLEIDCHPFKLEELLTTTIDMMTWSAAKKGLQLICVVDDAADLTIKGDSTRLRQVIVNLLGNALKFTETGDITIRVETVKRYDQEIELKFSVTDSGIGIPANRLNRLFKSFSQVDATTTRKYGGTGLGSSISQNLVELMGGKIGVDSTENVGSTFWFRLQMPIISKESVPAIDVLHQKHVLIIEPHNKCRDIFSEYCSGFQMEPIAFENSALALSHMQSTEYAKNPFQLAIISEHSVRDIDYRSLHSALTSGSVPIIAVTPFDISDEQRENKVEHVFAKIRKPVRRGELRDMMIAGFTTSAKKYTEQGNNDRANHSDTRLPGHILIAEDNSVNQMYMTELLKQHGCTCEVKVNGRDVVDALRANRYDLVLMDCQMPEMDGYEASRTIRSLEQSDELQQRTPIIALTANAVRGDLERCIEAGMDDYLSKPIEAEKFYAVLKRYLKTTETAKTEEIQAASSQTQNITATDEERSPIDTESFFVRCFKNIDFANTLIDEFEKSCDERLKEIIGGFERRDSDATADAAHSLKGATGILCATRSQELLAKIEKASRSADWERVATEKEMFCVELDRCRKYLPRVRQELTARK